MSTIVKLSTKGEEGSKILKMMSTQFMNGPKREIFCRRKREGPIMSENWSTWFKSQPKGTSLSIFSSF